MLKQKPFLFAVVYSVLVIAFKLFVFNSGLQMTKLGMYSHILSLLLMTPFILVLVFLERRNRGGQIGGKAALQQGLIFTSVSIVILSVFNYIFFEKELGAYIAEYIRVNAPKSLLETAAKNGKKVTMLEIDKMVQDGIDDLSAFKDTTRKLFSILIMGIFSSFIASIFLKTQQMAKQTVLVTGGAGYIGSHTIIELLANDNYNVISADCFFNSSPKAYIQIEEITGKKLKTYNIDLCNEKAFDVIFTENKIDGVIHFAAFKAVGESVEQPLKYYHNNIASLVNLLSLCEKYKVQNVIFSSSCSVYGNVEKLPVDENTHIPKAESPYAYTKQIGEIMLEDFCKQHLSFNAIALRYFNPVGAHTSAKIGEWPLNKPSNLVPLITGTAMGKFPTLTVLGGDYPTRDGTCIRDYIHVSDIATAHVLALDYLLQHKNKSNYNVFNLGSGNGVSVLEAIAAFEKVSGKKLNYTIGNRRAGDVIAVYSDSSKVQNAFGWKCMHNIDSMMKTAWEWELYRTESHFI